MVSLGILCARFDFSTTENTNLGAINQLLAACNTSNLFVAIITEFSALRQLLTTKLTFHNNPYFKNTPAITISRKQI